MSASIDDSQLRQLSLDLRHAAAEVRPRIRPVIKKGAGNIKAQMRAELAASEHFKGIAPSVAYETRETRSAVIADIFPDKGRSGGALANIAYFGSSRGGGTVPPPWGALEHERPNVIAHIERVLQGLL